jgi:hypothetical protein
MEYLVIGVILYFILQTAGNLVYILRGGGGKRESSASAPTHNWEGPSPRNQMEGITEHPTFWGENIEDASWQDVRD